MNMTRRYKMSVETCENQPPEHVLLTFVQLQPTELCYIPESICLQPHEEILFTKSILVLFTKSPFWLDAKTQLLLVVRSQPNNQPQIGTWRHQSFLIRGFILVRKSPMRQKNTLQHWGPKEAFSNHSNYSLSKKMEHPTAKLWKLFFLFFGHQVPHFFSPIFPAKFSSVSPFPKRNNPLPGDTWSLECGAPSCKLDDIHN